MSIKPSTTWHVIGKKWNILQWILTLPILYQHEVMNQLNGFCCLAFWQTSFIFCLILPSTQIWRGKLGQKTAKCSRSWYCSSNRFCFGLRCTRATYILSHLKRTAVVSSYCNYCFRYFVFIPARNKHKHYWFTFFSQNFLSRKIICKSWLHLSFRGQWPYRFRRDNRGCPGLMLVHLQPIPYAENLPFYQW